MTEGIAVVAGASGGIGRAVADGLVLGGRYDCVVALSRRRPEAWPTNDRQSWIAMDVLDESSLAEAAARLSAMGPVTRIIVATGLLHRSRDTATGSISPEKSMRSLSLDSLTTLFAVNAAGPALLAKHLLPLTPKGQPSLFAALSARVGSIGDNHLGGWYGYRASKAALNMLIRTLAIEHRRMRPLGACVVLHPGTVDTALSGPFQSGVPAGRLFSVVQSANALLAVMDRLGPDANGGFFAWDGSVVPW